MSQRLLFPELVLAQETKSYNRLYCSWLRGKGTWPLSISLGCPTEEQAIRQPDLIRDWIESWRKWHNVGDLSWTDRRWRQLGTQAVPVKLTLATPLEVAKLVGQAQRWERAVGRCMVLDELWPGVREEAATALLEALADYEETDFDRMIAVTKWLSQNQNSALFPRQLPIRGVDTKWLEGREKIIVALIDGITPEIEPKVSDTYIRLGLKRPPDLWRLRILDASLRRRLGELSDISAPLDDLLRLPITPSRVFIVENLQTFLAFEELQDTVVILGKGFGASFLGSIPWLSSSMSYYWGDIDTHGLAILSQVRSTIPAITSLLMSEETLLQHQDLWVKESRMNYATCLPNLTLEEASVYNGLKQQRWGTNVRLEQERIPWSTAWTTIRAFHGAHAPSTRGLQIT